MSNSAYYIWLIVLLIYIISPLDLFPGFFDDLLALGVLYYLSFKKATRKKQGSYSHYNTRSDSGNQSYQQDSNRNLSFEEACKTLGVSPDASWEEVKKAYKEKMTKCHPDKVSHLNEELQEKARELTLKLNNVLEIIKNSKGVGSHPR